MQQLLVQLDTLFSLSILDFKILEVGNVLRQNIQGENFHSWNRK